MPEHARVVVIWLCCLALVGGCAVMMRRPVESPLPLQTGERTISIMPLGDSISGSTGCWRSLLWNDLADAGYRDLDFVGERQGPECDEDYDDDSRAYSGYEATGIAEERLLYGWLERDPVDVMLVHLGSNDIRRGDSTEEILEALSILVDQMRQVNANMVIVVAQIIPMTETPMGKECSYCPGQVEELNARIPAWAHAHESIESPLIVVDQFDGFDAVEDTYDGLHTDDSGARKLADKWFEVLTEVLAPT